MQCAEQRLRAVYWSIGLLEIPLLPANRALVARPTLCVLALDPLHNTMQVKSVFAHAPRRWAVVSGSLAIRAVHLVRVPANAARLLALHVPVPVRYCVPAFYLHLHGTEFTVSCAKHFISSPGRRLSGFFLRHGFNTFSSIKQTDGTAVQRDAGCSSRSRIVYYTSSG